MSNDMGKLAKAVAWICGGDVGNTYDEQVKSPTFARVLMYNCILFNRLYGCAANGHCRECRAMEAISGAVEANPALREEFDLLNAILNETTNCESTQTTTNRR